MLSKEFSPYDWFCTIERIDTSLLDELPVLSDANTAAEFLLFLNSFDDSYICQMAMSRVPLMAALVQIENRVRRFNLFNIGTN